MEEHLQQLEQLALLGDLEATRQLLIELSQQGVPLLQLLQTIVLCGDPQNVYKNLGLTSTISKKAYFLCRNLGSIEFILFSRDPENIERILSPLYIRSRATMRFFRGLMRLYVRCPMCIAEGKDTGSIFDTTNIGLYKVISFGNPIPFGRLLQHAIIHIPEWLKWAITHAGQHTVISRYKITDFLD